MPAKKYIVRLSNEERTYLNKLVKTGKVAAYKRQRAQILLKADCGEEGPGLKDSDIAQQLEIGLRTVERTRQRLVELGLEKALERTPRKRNKPRLIDGEKEAQACLRPRDRFWDIPVPKIDSAFDNLFVPQPSWSPSTTQQLRKLVAAPYLSPNDWTPRSEAYFVFPLAQGTPGKQCGLAATGGYQPSLRSPWLAAVVVPQKDLDAGRVTRDADGKVFDWTQVTRGLMRIASSEKEPANASVKVHYRGTWFYIDDSDLESKSTFSLLGQLFALQSGEIKSSAPVLTLPVGN